MNVIKHTETVKKLIDKCESAHLADIPIIYIMTDEVEMINEIVESNRLVTLMVDKTEKDESTKYTPYTPSMGNLSEVFPKNYRRGLNDMPFKKSSIKSDKEDRSNHFFPYLFVQRVKDISLFSEALLDYAEKYIFEENDNSFVRKSVVILYGGDTSKYPKNLEQYTEFIDVDFPEESDIELLTTGIMAEYGLRPFVNHSDLDTLKVLLSGFSVVEINQILRRIITDDEITGYDTKSKVAISAHGTPGYNRIYNMDYTTATIRMLKEKILQRNEILELVNIKPNTEEVGGMETLTKWLEDKKPFVLQSDYYKKNHGTEAVKGILLCGVPGCGKSLAAKMTAKNFNLPLIRMDIGKLMGSYLGESERNLNRALRLIEAMTPCVLWIDELEKGFEGAKAAGSSDSGTFKRMFGTLLTWMQENEKPCFMFATANNLSGLPKEFFRSGRFDDLFAIYMPTASECVQIFKSCMKTAETNIKRDDSIALFSESCSNDKALYQLVEYFGQEKRFLTGADIKKIVNTSLMAVSRSDSKRRAPISVDEWQAAVKSVMSKITVYGDSMDNLENIAACYVRLIRNTFLPAADVVMFNRNDYKVDKVFDSETCNVKITVSMPRIDKNSGENGNLTSYDMVLYNELYPRFINLAHSIELIEHENLVR